MTSYRMAGEDCAMVRVHEESMMAVRAAWLYDRPVDMAQLAVFHRRLQQGRLGRVVAPALRYLGAAGDRWTARAQFAPLAVEPSPIARSSVTEWLHDRAGDELSSCGGPAWRLAVAELDNGGAVVSLVATHTIVDGRGLSLAIAEAVSDTNPDWTFAADHYGPLRLMLVDAGAAIRQFIWAAGCLLAMLFDTIRRVLARKSPFEVHIGPPRTQVPDGGFQPAPLAHVVARLDAERFLEASAERGGSPTTLAAAIATDLAVSVGRVDDQGRALLVLPVSMRDDSADTRGNALSSAAAVVQEHDRTEDLRPLRAEMKKAFGGVQARYRNYRLSWPVAMTYPRPRLQTSRRNISGADLLTTVCSPVGELDPQASRIDGNRADAVMMTLAWEHYRDPSRLTAIGGLLRVGLTQVDGEVTMPLSVMHPGVPLTEDELRAVATKTMEGYGLTPTFW